MSCTSKSANRRYKLIFWHARSANEPGGKAGDDRSVPQAPVGCSAMRIAGLGPVELLLPTGPGHCGRLGADGGNRPAIPGDALLRITQDGRGPAPCRLCCEPQKGLMRRMGLPVIWQKPNTSKPNPEH